VCIFNGKRGRARVEGGLMPCVVPAYNALFCRTGTQEDSMCIFTPFLPKITNRREDHSFSACTAKNIGNLLQTGTEA
jgi:hypothetical protein